MSRDYAAEMRALMDAERTGPNYVKAIARDNIIEKLRETDQELWYGWLDLMGPQILWEALDQIDRHERAATKKKASPRARAARAAKALQAGNPEPAREFLDMPISYKGTTVPLGKMRGTDCLLAKPTYDKLARGNRLMGALLAACAKKAGSRLIEEVYTEEQLAAMWHSLGSRDAA